MAKIVRKTMVAFGQNGPTTSFGQFGSKEAGFPQTTKDPTVIQQLAAWSNGWQDAVVTANKAAYLEDMNGMSYVFSYMLGYVLQQGIPEWDMNTVYYRNSVVQDNSGQGQWFNSLQDNNQGNQPPVSASNAFWQWVNPPPTPPPPSIPTGTLIDFAGGPTPAGFLGCDGSAVSRVTYAALFTQIGVIWGAGDGVNTFNVPDFRRRTSVGSGGAGSLVLGNTPGSVGGEETHTLTIPEMPAHTHNHSFTDTAAANVAGGATYSTAQSATSSTGGSGPHNNMQPSAVVLKLIKT
jgi:microcystin-dependent protein